MGSFVNGSSPSHARRVYYTLVSIFLVTYPVNGL